MTIISGMSPEERSDLEKYGQDLLIPEEEIFPRSKLKNLGRRHWKNKVKRRRRRGGGR